MNPIPLPTGLLGNSAGLDAKGQVGGAPANECGKDGNDAHVTPGVTTDDSPADQGGTDYEAKGTINSTHIFAHDFLQIWF